MLCLHPVHQASVRDTLRLEVTDRFVTALAFVAVLSVWFSRVAHRLHGKPDTEVQIVDSPGSEGVP
ncbi:hypothetical protein IQ62_28700 [Streptomyces scabiei]|nr:hypothetical protein IQ62_28700 [Streptomyces scabiei]